MPSAITTTYGSCTECGSSEIGKKTKKTKKKKKWYVKSFSLGYPPLPASYVHCKSHGLYSMHVTVEERPSPQKRVETKGRTFEGDAGVEFLATGRQRDPITSYCNVSRVSTT